MTQRCDTCNKRLTGDEFYFCGPCERAELASFTQPLKCDRYKVGRFTLAVPRLGVAVPPPPPQPEAPYTDTELEWFKGGPCQVTEVIHLVTEADIVGEEPT